MNLWKIPIDERGGKATGPPRPVTLPARFAAHLSISQTGQIVFAALERSDVVHRYSFDPVSESISGPGTPVLSGYELVHSVQVSPDGQWLLTTNVGSPQDVMMVKSDGSESRQITNDREIDRGASWSPDGRLIYFFSQRNENRYEIWSIKPDGSGLSQVTSTKGPSVWFPRLSPDGKWMATYNVAGTFLFDLSRLPAVEPIVLPPIKDSSLNFQGNEWSADGREILGDFARASDGVDVPGIWIYSLGKKSYQQLWDRSGASSVVASVWLDEERILCSDDEKLYVVDRRGRAREVATPVPANVFSLSPDKRTIYFTERVIQADIWRMTLE